LLYYQENFIFICSKLFFFMYRMMTHNHSFLKQQYSITNFKLCSYIFCDRRFNIDNLLVLESFKKSSQVMPSMLLALAFQSIFCYTFWKQDESLHYVYIMLSKTCCTKLVCDQISLVNQSISLEQKSYVIRLILTDS
jgi:hypothetical protein